jgi:hypothetical protein
MQSPTAPSRDVLNGGALGNGNGQLMFFGANGRSDSKATGLNRLIGGYYSPVCEKEFFMAGGDDSSDESEDKGEEEDDEFTDSDSDSDDSIATVTQRSHASSRTRENSCRSDQVAGSALLPRSQKRPEYMDVTAFKRLFTVHEVIQRQFQPQPYPIDPVRTLPWPTFLGIQRSQMLISLPVTDVWWMTKFKQEALKYPTLDRSLHP